MSEKKKEIVSLKGNPELILPTLEATHKYGKDRRKFIDHIVGFARTQLKSDAKEENLVSNQAIPMCVKLGFISGELGNLRLEDSGRLLLSAFGEGGDPKYKNSLREALIRADKNERYGAQILSVLMQIANSSNRVKVNSLTSALKKRGVIILGDRLGRILGLFMFANVISEKVGVIELKVSTSEYKRVLGKDPFKKISREEFVDALRHAYFALTRNQWGELIEIPKLRNLIGLKCKISGDYFNSMLESLPPDVFEGESISFSSALFGKVGGLSRGGKYFYYLTINKKGR